MSPAKSLPVIMPAIPGQRWSCHSCGDCCRTLVGHITPAERARIDEQGWRRELGTEPYVRVGRSWALNKTKDGACVFLDENNRCRIHARFGEQAKPLACRVFPFSLRRTAHGWQASFRFDCPSASLSQGEPIRKHQGWLSRLAGELDHNAEPVERAARLQRRMVASPRELDALDRHMLEWLRQSGHPLNHRLFAAARLTTTLYGARLRKVRGDRFIELVNLLFNAAPSDGAPPNEAPTPRQRGMLRQSAFAHAEHVTLDQARRGFPSRMIRRLRQLQSARDLLRGEGLVPQITGFDGRAAFDQVDRVQPATAQIADIEQLILRFLSARIEGRAVYGGGYYGWPACTGYAALWLSLAVTGWLARYHAAISGRDTLSFVDVAGAIAVVDRAAARLPALGMFAERARVHYLLRDDGLARLLQQYALVTGDPPDNESNAPAS